MMKNQQGAALLITLAMLSLMTVLGIASIQSTSMQERMARNYRDVNMAFQGAEAAVKEAEDFIEGIANVGAFPEEDDSPLCVNGLCNSEDGTERWTTIDWSDSSTDYVTTTTTKTQLNVAAAPRYVIEYVAKVTIEQDTLNIGNVGEGGSSGRAYIYRITARGTGGTAESHAMIQALYGRQF